MNKQCVLFLLMQCNLELHDICGTVDHGTAFGRIAFSCPREQVKCQFEDTLFCLLIFENDCVVIMIANSNILSHSSVA